MCVYDNNVVHVNVIYIWDMYVYVDKLKKNEQTCYYIFNVFVIYLISL